MAMLEVRWQTISLFGTPSMLGIGWHVFFYQWYRLTVNWQWTLAMLSVGWQAIS